MEKMSEMCVTYVESDIARLSQRRRELLKELSHVDAAMQERVQALARVKASMNGEALSHTQSSSEKHPPNSEPSDISITSLTLETGDQIDKKKTHKLSYLSKRQDSRESEEDLSDPEMFAAVLREEIQMLLFSVDRSDADEVVVYLLPTSDTPDIVTAHRAAMIDDELRVTRIGAYEWMVAYGAKVVPNHEREEPATVELPIPDSKPGDAMAVLVGAIEVPCAPDVIIDVWRTDNDVGKFWATTSINGISFCQLERISLKSETHWGLSSVVQIALHGRHPFTGADVIETIDMGGGEDD